VKAGELAGFLILALILIFVAYIVVQPNAPNPEMSYPRATIVDQLSARFPNQEFTEEAEKTMQEAGLKVDIYAPEEVTVNLYATLPTHGYRLIIFRVHAGVNQEMKASSSERDPSPTMAEPSSS
jgi:hypothetical protein